MGMGVVVAGAGTVCVLAAGGVGVLGVGAGVVWWLRRKPPQLTTTQEADPAAQRAKLRRQIEMGLGCLRDPTFEELPQGGLRVRGTLDGPATFELQADGTVSRLHTEGSYAYGGVVLRRNAEPHDPGRLLDRLDQIELADLLAQLEEASVSEVRLETSGVDLVVDGGLFDDGVSAAGVLSVLENAANLWGWLEAEEREQEQDQEEPEEAHAPPLTGTKASLVRAIEEDSEETVGPGFSALFDEAQTLLDRPTQRVGGVSDEHELRGWLGEVPLRCMVDYEGNLEIEARVENTQWASFEYDPDCTPVVGDPEDPFADEDVIRVFVAKGVYVEADPEAVDRAMQFIAGFPPQVIERIRGALVDLPVSKISYGVEELYLYGGPLHKVEDPGATLKECMTLVAELAGALGGHADAVLGQSKCPYCSSRYFFGVNQPGCPNCGAPKE